MSKFIAIDLDPQGLFAVAGSARAGHARVDNAVAWDGTDGEGPPALTLETAKRLGEKLHERCKAAGMSGAPVLVSIPRDRVILKELRYPSVPPPEEPALVRFQAMKELTDAPDDVVIDYVPLPGAGPEGERRSMAFAVRKELFAAIQAMCAAGNMKLAGVTPRPFCVAAGLMRAVATGAAPKPESKDPLAVITVGPGGGEFTVFRPEGHANRLEVIFTRTVAAPALANEALLLSEVRRNLTMYAGANPAHPIQAIYVADTDGRWVNKLRAALGIAVHSFNPMAGYGSALPESTLGRFAGAVGLLAVSAAGELPINFAVPRQPKVEKDPNQRRLILSGLLALLVVGGALGAGALYADSEQRELARLQQHKQDLEDEATRLDPDYKRFQAVEGWQNRQVVWLDMLYDLSDQFQHKDGAVAVSYTGKAILPDAKTGKQDAQANLEIKLTSHSPTPVDVTAASMEADNLEPKSPRDTSGKFYASVFKGTNGAAPNDSTSREYVVRARVNHREPDQFIRNTPFSPFSRWDYPPPVAAPAKDKDAMDEGDDPEGDPPPMQDTRPKGGDVRPKGGDVRPKGGDMQPKGDGQPRGGPRGGDMQPKDNAPDAKGSRGRDNVPRKKGGTGDEG